METITAVKSFTVQAPERLDKTEKRDIKTKWQWL
jgi:hypothetical protein